MVMFNSKRVGGGGGGRGKVLFNICIGKRGGTRGGGGRREKETGRFVFPRYRDRGKETSFPSPDRDWRKRRKKKKKKRGQLDFDVDRGGGTSVISKKEREKGGGEKKKEGGGLDFVFRAIWREEEALA